MLVAVLNMCSSRARKPPFFGSKLSSTPAGLRTFQKILQVRTDQPVRGAPPFVQSNPQLNPHDRKGGGLIVKIPNFCEETLSECLFEICFSHNTLMVKLLVCRVRHEEYQGSPTTLLNNDMVP